MKQADPEETLRATAALMGAALSAAQAASLLRFEELLRERAVPAGFVSAGDLPRLRERHILDCLRAAAVVVPDDAAAFDLGSGAGLPGVVVAIAVPRLAVTLVESRRSRAAFLELVVADLGLGNAAVAHARIQEFEGEADLAFARAVAPWTEAWSLARRLLRPGGRLVYFAGARAEVPSHAADASGIETRTSTVLESAGPLVIMAR